MRTSIDDRKDNADILIKNCNGGSYTIKNQSGIPMGKRGVKREYENGYLEITRNKLEKLTALYSVETDF